MIGLLQRVDRAEVTVDDRTSGAIGRGILVFAGVEKHDTPAQAARLAERLCGYRVFPDSQGRMNRSVTEVGGGVLLVPQFTLAADTTRGMRASLATAADPATGRALYLELVERVRALCHSVQSGVFGADMRVSLINNGPVTYWLRAPPKG